jgi:SAM-dependent methyltransferase
MSVAGGSSYTPSGWTSTTSLFGGRSGGGRRRRLCRSLNRFVALPSRRNQNPCMKSLPGTVARELRRSGYSTPGFAARYDAYRPRPPAILLDLLPFGIQNERPALVVDLGSGTGLSTRFWSERADFVVGVEPNPEMLSYAKTVTGAENVRYVGAPSAATGLGDACADIVTSRWFDSGRGMYPAGRVRRRRMVPDSPTLNLNLRLIYVSTGRVSLPFGSPIGVAALRTRGQVGYSKLGKERSHREEALMEGSSVAVPGMQPPRFERRRGRGVVGCTVAVLAALLCASLFAATARAEDPAPSVSDASATSSNSMPSDAASTASSDGTAPTDTSDISATTTDGSGTADTTDTCATAPDATDTSATTTDDSAAAAGTTETCATAPDATDTSATTTDDSAAAADTTSTRASVADATDTSATTTDDSAAAADTTITCASVPDATDTSATTTGTSAPAADTTDTCASVPGATETTDGTTATDPSAAPTDASGAAASDAAADSETDVSNSTNDPTGTTTAPAAAPNTRLLSSSGASPSGAADPPASPPDSSLQAPSDAATTDSSFDSTSDDGDAEADTFLEGPISPFATALPQGEALTLILALVATSCGVDCRVNTVCAETPGSLVLASCPAKAATVQAEPPAARTNGAQSRSDGTRGPKSPRLPIPDREPQMPSAPGASSGSGSSGGPDGGSSLGVTAAMLSLTPWGGTRLITRIEQCPRALPLAFLLDRPG